MKMQTQPKKTKNKVKRYQIDLRHFQSSNEYQLTHNVWFPISVL